MSMARPWLGAQGFHQGVGKAAPLGGDPWQSIDLGGLSLGSRCNIAL